MIFTRHAAERYRQFWLLDQATATDDEALSVLVAHGDQAVKLPARTIRGDEVWTIHALGVELVVKRDRPEPMCVTVLPPPRFRGLTPLQAEIMEEAVRASALRAEEAERMREDMEAAALAEAATRLSGANSKAVAARQAAEHAEVYARRTTRAREREANSKAAAARQAAEHAEACARKAATAKAPQDLTERRVEAKSTVSMALAERDILCSALKTMRAQLHVEAGTETMKSALRVAVRALRPLQTTEALGALAAIAVLDPGLVSDAFVYGKSRKALTGDR